MLTCAADGKSSIGVVITFIHELSTLEATWLLN